ncbi:MAG TPA: TlpA disulfide reductase family protein [Acidobacteriaceae bacterium]|jgi:thiol-disulfide isomerase/thioredoxin|nr:TlpA disulfide reductase family protein [Acidobacteriaceae bacterium]
MTLALALMVTAGVVNFLHRRAGQRARMRGPQLTLVPENASGSANPPVATDTSDAGAPTPLEGKPAPAFTLVDLSGKKVSLESYRGHPLVVDFWATWCGPCKVEIPWFEKLHDQYAGQGLEILGLSTDDLDKDDPARLFTEKRDIADFAQKMHMNYPVLLNGESVEDAYGLEAYPTTFYIDRTGKVVASTVGLVPLDEIESDIKKAMGAAS